MFCDGKRLPEKDDARRIAIRQRTQQHAVEQREHRAVDADAQRQRQHDQQRESGPAERVAAGEGDVAEQQIELHSAPALTACMTSVAASVMLMGQVDTYVDGALEAGG